jgi:hypothetical protein
MIDDAPCPAPPFERLRAGEIDLEEYFDLKIRQATDHLRHLSSAEMMTLRRALRERLESDPLLVELVELIAPGPVSSEAARAPRRS